MDIIVEGNGKMFFKPNEVNLFFTFNAKDKNYDTALAKGVENVKEYFDHLITLGFKKEDIKTRAFRVSEDKKYDEKTRKYVTNGYIFTQDSTLKFDYDMKKLATLIEETSKIANGPVYKIYFGIKDNKEAEEQVLALAYKDAEINAKAIANASGKKLIDCKKVSFEPFDDVNYSRTDYDGRCYSKASTERCSINETIQEVFVPEDIELEKTIYCLFVAE